MSAEGILDDPALFFGQHQERPRLRQALKAAGGGVGSASKVIGSPLPNDPAALAKVLALLTPGAEEGAASEPPSEASSQAGGARPSRLGLCLEYLALASRFPVKQSSVVFHARRMCRAQLAAYEMADDLATAPTVEAAQKVVAQLVEFDRNPG